MNIPIGIAKTAAMITAEISHGIMEPDFSSLAKLAGCFEEEQPTGNTQKMGTPGISTRHLKDSTIAHKTYTNTVSLFCGGVFIFPFSMVRNVGVWLH